MLRTLLALACVALAAQGAAGSGLHQSFHPISASGVVGGVCLVAGVVPLAAIAPAAGFQAGCSQPYVIYAADGEQGNCGYLRPPACAEGLCADNSGSKRLECALAYGTGCAIGLQGWVETMTGVRRGALRDAFQVRFGQDTDRRQGLCHDQYLGNGERVIVIPVVDRLGNGRDVVMILGYAAFFLRALPSSDDSIEAEFLYMVAPGSCG